MQVKQRYTLLCVTVVLLLCFGYIGYLQIRSYRGYVKRGLRSGYVPYDPGPVRYVIPGRSLKSYIDQSHAFQEDTHSLDESLLTYRGAALLDPSPDEAYLKKQDIDGFGFVDKDGEEVHGYNLNCRMETCFDYSRCNQQKFYVYVYPVLDNKVGPIYAEILSALFSSHHYTSDPDKACLFITSIDTLDRDERSHDRYIHDANARLHQLPYWNGGRNHLLFNIYSGTWPDYREHELAFDLGYAMLAKASVSQAYHRPGFDISFPLFHSELTSRGGEPGALLTRKVPPSDKGHTLVFKGKRYLKGIGSETRNALYHIDNGQDVLLLTTCRHGNGWQKIQDERCEKDNMDYDKYDYKSLLHNSTFCLVPRGRRLGSYRFLESLQAACIPVLLSNGWVLPFSEVIDWNKAVVWADERLLLQVPSIVRSLSHSDILSLRQHTQFLWETYFSSIEKIVDTTLQIIKERVYPHASRSGFVWNNFPGALSVDTEYTQILHQLPFYHKQLGVPVSKNYTSLVYAVDANVVSGGSLYKLLAAIGRTRYCSTVVILWHCNVPPPLDKRWPVPPHMNVVVKIVRDASERYKNHLEITTDCVLMLDASVTTTTDELDFSYSVWSEFPSRIIGFSARSHYWDESLSRWAYSSKPSNQYSLVLTDAAAIHRYYLHLYETTPSEQTRHLVQGWPQCSDLLVNFIVSHVTKLPPIKITARYRSVKNEAQAADFGTAGGSNPKNNRSSAANLFEQRSACLNNLASEYGYMPLKRSNVRLDPHLYGDPVSIARKKYRQIEHIKE